MVSHVFRLCVLTWLTDVLCFISKSIQVKQTTFDIYLPDNTNLDQLKVGACFCYFFVVDAPPNILIILDEPYLVCYITSKVIM